MEAPSTTTRHWRPKTVSRTWPQRCEPINLIARRFNQPPAQANLYSRHTTMNCSRMGCWMQGLEGDFENELVHENVDNYLPPWLDKTCESPVSPPRSPRSRELPLCRHLSKMIGEALTAQANKTGSGQSVPTRMPMGTARRKVSKDGEFAITRRRSTTFRGHLRISSDEVPRLDWAAPRRKG